MATRHSRRLQDAGDLFEEFTDREEASRGDEDERNAYRNFFPPEKMFASTIPPKLLTCGRSQTARYEQICRRATGDWEKNGELVRRWQKFGDQEAREEILVKNIRLVVDIAKKFRGRGLESSDLIQEGLLGLFEALNRFDYRKGCRFSTYATPWIKQKIKRAIYEQPRPFRWPIHKIELRRKIGKLIKLFLQEKSDESLDERIARWLEISIEKVRQERADMIAKHIPLEDMRTGRNDNDELELDKLTCLTDKEGLSPLSRLEAKETLYEYCDGIRRLVAALRVFSARDQEIFRARYGINCHLKPFTLQAIGKNWGLSREGVRQVIDRIWRKLAKRRNIYDQRRLILWLEYIHDLATLLDCDLEAIFDHILSETSLEPSTK